MKKKATREPLTVRIDIGVLDSLRRWVAEADLRPSQSAVVEAALRDYLAVKTPKDKT